MNGGNVVRPPGRTWGFAAQQAGMLGAPDLAAVLAWQLTRTLHRWSDWVHYLLLDASIHTLTHLTTQQTHTHSP